ncbi:hypothetical protein M758_9G121400 [Ceratodon purpureus]|nr:hypothetical protein M758_9G121400 [Ceratodon purpureus]
MAMAMFSCSSALLPPLSVSTWKPALAPVSRRAIVGKGRFTLRVRAAAQKQKRENVETPNISTPPLPAGSSPLEAGSEDEDADAVSSSGQDEAAAAEEKELSPEEIGQQLKAMRIARGDVAPSSGNFWDGVIEETKLVEWPQFNKVLGTTGVVVGIIFGSAILLLTLNAGLAELSDQVFNGSSEFAKSWTRGSF